MGNATSRGEWAVHGALDYGELERLGLHPQDMLDFSVNANPYGPSPRVREAVANTVIDRYPDRECLALRRAILEYELNGTNLPLSSIVCGNGTIELIWAIARAYLKPGLKAAILGPTFGEYRVACLATGATVVEFRAQADACFQPDIVAVAAWISREQPSLVWLCNPNNPTGTWLDQHRVQLVAATCQRTGAMLVVDEAYWRFVFPARAEASSPTTGGGKLPRPSSTLLPPLRSTPAPTAVELVDTIRRSRVIVLRSLTKDFALAGLRLGYAIATPDVAERIGAQLPSWNVNGLAQAAGIVALSDRTHLETTLDNLAIERLAFFHALREIGVNIIPSRTHFCLIEVGDAHRVRQELLLRKILVRDCTSFGLSQFVRVATRPRGEWQRLLLALQEIV
jgi:histidinol-phosphate aminotransferase